MTLTISPFRYPVQPIALNPKPADSVVKPEKPLQQRAVASAPPVTSEYSVSPDLEYRTRYSQRYNFQQDQPSSRSQQALRAYNSIIELEERARVSELFGLNEYA